jgi:outer membrane protein assembly factor BamB
MSAGNAVCVALADGSVRCVRTADGRKLARITLPGTQLSTPVRGDGLVFAAAADGSVGAWDVGSGARPWLFRPAAPAPAAAHLVRRANQVVAAYPDGRLIGLDARTGRSQWDATLPDHFDTAPRMDAKALYVVGRTGTLYALRVPRT